jgi:hypothetical protein
VRFLRIILPSLIFFGGCHAPEPDADPSAEAVRILGEPHFTWRTIRAPGARIHYSVGSYAEQNQAVLAKRVAESRAAVLKRLGLQGYSRSLDVFYVDSRDEMRQLTGQPVTGMAYTGDDMVVLVFNDEWRAFERHELTHVISRRTWGEPGDPFAATLEGLAVYVDGDCGGYEVGRVARTVADKGEILTLEELLGDFRAQDDLVAYLQAGSIVEYYVRQRGTQSLQRLWERGLGAAPTLLGSPTPLFERNWREWLRSSWGPLPDEAWERIRADGCGIDKVSNAR